jgi:wobble nucleotide-excising tRNase
VPPRERQVLTKIKKIRSLGVFDDYTVAADLPAFGRYNIVYGENGSGKTTLSRLLGCLEAGEHPDHPNLEYAVESQSGPLTHGTKYARKVRVFNSDYVEANIGRFDGPLRHILILGEENKALAEELKVEIGARDARSARIQAVNASVAKLDTDKGKLFSQIAKTIGEATSGSTLRSYRKPDAESAFAKLTDAKSLSEQEVDVHRATVRQEQMAAIGPVKVPLLVGEDGEVSVIELAANAAARAKALTMRSAQAAVIERLAQNPKIAAWVEEGVHIHADNSQKKCEFCDQPLPADRLKALADHFSIEDQRLKEELEAERSALGKSREALNGFSLPDRLALYSELRSDYDAAAQSFESERGKLKGQLEKVDQALAEKLMLRTSAYERELVSQTGPLVAALDAIHAVIKRHNDKTVSFNEEKLAARNSIESHYLLSIKDQVDEIGKQAGTLHAEATLLRDGGEGLDDKRSLEALSQSIVEKQAQVSNAHAGGADLTKHLKQFLGRTDLRFESGDDGYSVLRRGKPAKRLSEGEKTAIAFLYFLVQLKDQNFDPAEGVVVIDDPISSLDASAIYQAFSFLKNETQAAKQLFILTHNFEFLKLLINWVQNLRVPKTDKTYTMVLCAETEGGRSARLAPLDKLLIEHATEYHYLFKVLFTFKSDGTISGCYHIPNIARKVLETFLDFHVPSSKSLYQKLDETNFDLHKKTAIYKFANDLSHYTGKSFDPAIVAETQKNTAHLLEMIEVVAPLHYGGLKKLSEV